jgi:uncharacterized membrane protein
MASPTTPSGGQTNLGLAPNVAGMLCYFPLCCVGLIFSIVAVIVEKQSRFVRFHAFQSLLVHGALVVAVVAMQIFSFVLAAISGLLSLLFSLLFGILGLGILGAMIFLMVKAYNNEEYSLPTLGELARNWSSQ